MKKGPGPGALGPTAFGPQSFSAPVSQNLSVCPEATKRGAADKTLKSGSEAVNAHRTIVRTSMCRHIKHVLLKILK